MTLYGSDAALCRRTSYDVMELYVMENPSDNYYTYNGEKNYRYLQNVFLL